MNNASRLAKNRNGIGVSSMPGATTRAWKRAPEKNCVSSSSVSPRIGKLGIESQSQYPFFKGNRVGLYKVGFGKRAGLSNRLHHFLPKGFEFLACQCDRLILFP